MTCLTLFGWKENILPKEHIVHCCTLALHRISLSRWAQNIALVCNTITQMHNCTIALHKNIPLHTGRMCFARHKCTIAVWHYPLFPCCTLALHRISLSRWARPPGGVSGTHCRNAALRHLCFLQK